MAHCRKKIRSEMIEKLEYEPEPTLEDVLREHPSISLRQDHDDMFGGLGSCTPILDEVAKAFYRRFVGGTLKYSATEIHEADFFTRAVARLLADADHPVYFTCTVPGVGPVKVRVLTCIGLQRLLCLVYAHRSIRLHAQTWATLENGGALSNADHRMGIGESFRQEHIGPLDGTDADAVIKYLNDTVGDAHTQRETFVVGQDFFDTASALQKMYTWVLVRASVSAVATLLDDPSWETVWKI
jgi:hypothetical protein